MEDRTGARVNVMAAKLADKGAALGKSMKFRIFLAFWSLNFSASIIHFHELRQAGVIVRVHLLELLECALGHDRYPLPAIVG